MLLALLPFLSSRGPAVRSSLDKARTTRTDTDTDTETGGSEGTKSEGKKKQADHSYQSHDELK